MGYIKKVCLLGDPAVGKTSLVQRYVTEMFDERYLSTIGTKPSVKNLKHNGTEVTLTLWDIAGQESFQNVHANYFKGAEGAVLVCDITRPETKRNLARWVHRFRSASPGGAVVVVSNKWDLVGDEMVALGEEQEIVAFAGREGCEYLRSSAKEGTNVEEAFGLLVERIMESGGRSPPVIS